MNAWLPQSIAHLASIQGALWCAGKNATCLEISLEWQVPENGSSVNFVFHIAFFLSIILFALSLIIGDFIPSFIKKKNRIH